MDKLAFWMMAVCPVATDLSFLVCCCHRRSRDLGSCGGSLLLLLFHRRRRSEGRCLHRRLLLQILFAGNTKPNRRKRMAEFAAGVSAIRSVAARLDLLVAGLIGRRRVLHDDGVCGLVSYLSGSTNTTALWLSNWKWQQKQTEGALLSQARVVWSVSFSCEDSSEQRSAARQTRSAPGKGHDRIRAMMSVFTDEHVTSKSVGFAIFSALPRFLWVGHPAVLHSVRTFLSSNHGGRSSFLFLLRQGRCDGALQHLPGRSLLQSRMPKIALEASQGRMLSARSPLHSLLSARSQRYRLPGTAPDAFAARYGEFFWIWIGRGDPELLLRSLPH